jgi:hypothetical protein
MPLLSRLDTLAAVLAAATGLAMAEDHGRTEISSPPAVTAEAVSPETLRPERSDPEPMTPELCAELAEYRRRALRATIILAGGMPDGGWPGQIQDPSAECATSKPMGQSDRRNPAPD